MANQAPLASWLYSKRTELSARFKEYSWPARVFPEVFDFETKISWGSVEAIGRGVDFSREVALEKSVAESIERLICQTLGFSSVGFAVAGGSFDPSLHAKFEALERFHLNKHLSEKIKLHRLDVNKLSLNGMDSFLERFTADFYRMRTVSGIYGVVCRLSTREMKSVSFGFSLSDHQERSMQKAFFEALPGFAWLTSGEELEANSLPWQIETGFVQRMDHLLADEEQFVSEISLPELSNESVDCSKIPVLLDAPLRTARFVLEGAD